MKTIIFIDIFLINIYFFFINKLKKKMCLNGESYYFDFQNCIKKYTVVMNHLITNEIDESQIMV